jgi:hypothetical protein
MIAKTQPNPPEELITALLEGHLRGAFEEASKNRQIESAFVEDLRSQIRGFSRADAQRFTGLIATVNPHTKPHEATVSGADFGLLIVRPQIRTSGWAHETVHCSRDHATGLLAQAKLGHQKKRGLGHRWNGLKQNQADLLPNLRSYYSLLLYRLNGMNGTELEPLRWQLCHDSTVEDVKSWLRLDAFPDEIPSSEVLIRLFHRQIGTEDPDIIKNVIAPEKAKARVIEIYISWPPGAEPPSSCSLEKDHRRHEANVQKLYQ